MGKLDHQVRNEPLLSRRGFLIGTVGAGACFGFAPARRRAGIDRSAQGFEPTIWYSIDRDGIVTVNIIRAEMGQHIGTALARIVADELEADWDKVRIDAVDTDPKWGVMMTGGSWSVWQTFRSSASRRRRSHRSDRRRRETARRSGPAVHRAQRRGRGR